MLMLLSSFPRKQESIYFKGFWIPALRFVSAGMTVFYSQRDFSAACYATVFRGTSLNGLSVSPVRSRGIFSTRSLMMLRWISSVPPAIELAGTDTRISDSNPLMGLSSPVSSASGPSSDVCTRAAARAMMLDASLPREP